MDNWSSSVNNFPESKDGLNSNRLIPVITYVEGLFRDISVGALLSFFSLCHQDNKEEPLLPDMFSVIDENACFDLLNEMILKYLRIEKLSIKTQKISIEMAFLLIRNISEKNVDFVKERCIRICGKEISERYWKTLTDYSTVKNLYNYFETLSMISKKMLSDFSLFLISIAVFYGCRGENRKRIYLLEKNLKEKFGDLIHDNKLSLCLWPFNFSFIQPEYETGKNNGEYQALLQAVRTINPDFTVQVCQDSLQWVRDEIAWLDNEYSCFIQSNTEESESRFSLGALSEGGNVIAGKGKSKFILIAESPLSDVMESIEFLYELNARKISTYILPDGFLWAKHPQSGECFLLDSIHIDTVINVLPQEFTTDNRLKVLIDPYYYMFLKNSLDFKRFIKEQAIGSDDIVIIDERECYLNLANFSIIPEKSGNKKLLFNKDKGLTLCRLNLKQEYVVQPEIEIVNLASSFGCIRCATNLLPEYIVNYSHNPTITISEKFKDETAVLLRDSINRLSFMEIVSNLWIKEICVEQRNEKIQWEFDDSTRTVYIYLIPEQISSPETITASLNNSLHQIADKLNNLLY